MRAPENVHKWKGMKMIMITMALKCNKTLGDNERALNACRLLMRGPIAVKYPSPSQKKIERRKRSRQREKKKGNIHP